MKQPESRHWLDLLHTQVKMWHTCSLVFMGFPTSGGRFMLKGCYRDVGLGKVSVSFNGLATESLVLLQLVYEQHKWFFSLKDMVESSV